MSFCSDAVLNHKPIYGNYWINTSANDIIEEFIQYADDSQLKLMKQLLEGKTVEVQIFEELSFSELEAKHSTETLLSLLFAAGYLTSAGKTEEGLHILRIPNEEVRKCFERRLVQWFSKGGQGYQVVGDRLKTAFVAGDFYGAQSCLQAFLFKCASVRDGSTEAFYHGTVLGLLGGADPDGVTSNQESGEGYYDILYADSARGVGVIIALKKAKSDDGEVLLETSRQGLQQIYQRRYYARFLGTNICTVQLCGVAFSGKVCRIVGETKEVASLA